LGPPFHRGPRGASRCPCLPLVGGRSLPAWAPWTRAGRGVVLQRTVSVGCAALSLAGRYRPCRTAPRPRDAPHLTSPGIPAITISVSDPPEKSGACSPPAVPW